MKHTIQVWSRPYEVTVEQRSKSVWVASGDYQGQSIVVTDRTPTSALKRWREAAQYKGNL
jgi:DNA-binding beta-propeller fold protein YncE